MRKEERFVFLLEGIDDTLLLRAMERNTVSENVVFTKKKKRFLKWGILAAASLCLILMAVTPGGKVLAAEVKESIEDILERLFPPKEITVNPEGMEENITHTAQIIMEEDTLLEEVDGKETVNGKQDTDILPNGFAIYVDEESYSAGWEENIYVIRPLTEPIEGLTECRIEIWKESDISIREAAEEKKDALEDAYENVSEIAESMQPEGLSVSAYAATDWDSECVEYYITDDGKGGVYVIAAWYFMEAAEGHGTRFHTMIQTFEVLE